MPHDDVLAFWFEGDPETWRDAWFHPDTAFDNAIRDRFGTLPDAAQDGALDGWATTPQGAVALCLVLDQFPRNLNRGGARAFAYDARARDLAVQAVLRERLDMTGGLTANERCFLYLPFEHSEAMVDQDLSVALFEGLRDAGPRHAAADGTIDYAWRHRAVIRRFGRYPHRNAALGRESKPEEAAFLTAYPLGF